MQAIPHNELLQFTQMVFNKWVRTRDINKPCISSGGRAEQAGHYYPAGSFSGVRFDEINVNGQSKFDNCFKDGNPDWYRSGLIVRYGLQTVLDLDERARATKNYKWSRTELERIIEQYTIKR